MGSPFFQDVNPPVTPDPVTPQAAPGDPAGWAKVTPAGPGPAPYDISAPQDIAGIAAAVDAAGALTGAGVLYPKGPRQAEAQALLESPQGAPGMNVFAGFPDYENTDIRPPDQAVPLIPAAGAGYPGTTQGGIPQYTGQEGAGVEGVPPEGGSMDTPGGNYPGTTQGGLPTYGTS